MGVYIPNIEMPKSCSKCPLNSAPPNGCLIWTINDIREGKRNKSCPLIEIDDTVWENEKYKLIRMTQEARINKEMAERRANNERL